MALTRQLSLFGIEATTPSIDDLDGLLAGPGQVVRMGGTARVSVVVEAMWRAAALTAEMRTRGLAATCVATVDEHLGVRTPYSAALAPLANAWLRGALKLPPTGYVLDGRRLRLWMIAAGYRDDLEMTLRLGRCEPQVELTMQRALALIGLPAEVLVGSARTGPSLRITGRRRMARLAETVGDPPSAAPPDAWP
ncbi:MAG TPA: hypothetical protein VH442_18545 [Micromonosporaceae bacterium]